MTTETKADDEVADTLPPAYEGITPADLYDLGTRFAVDNETVAWGLFSIAHAIDRLADAIADATSTPKQKPRLDR